MRLNLAQGFSSTGWIEPISPSPIWWESAPGPECYSRVSGLMMVRDVVKLCPAIRGAALRRFQVAVEVLS